MAPTAPTSNETDDFEFRALEHATNYRRALVREFAPYLRGQVIESGSGIGQMTELLLQQRAITRLVCVEPNPQFCSKLSAKFPSLELYEGSVEHLPSGNSWNVVVSVNVLEHIENDRQELRKYFELLREAKGYLCLIVPARPEIYGPIDRSFGHFRRYTKNRLGARLAGAGFVLERLAYFNVIGYFAWWLNFRLLRSQQFSCAQVKFFDSAIFPVMHWWETKVFRPPIGQSLIAIAQAR